MPAQLGSQAKQHAPPEQNPVVMLVLLATSWFVLHSYFVTHRPDVALYEKPTLHARGRSKWTGGYVATTPVVASSVVCAVPTDPVVLTVALQYVSDLHAATDAV